MQGAFRWGLGITSATARERLLHDSNNDKKGLGTVSSSLLFLNKKAEVARV